MLNYLYPNKLTIEGTERVLAVGDDDATYNLPIQYLAQYIGEHGNFNKITYSVRDLGISSNDVVTLINNLPPFTVNNSELAFFSSTTSPSTYKYMYMLTSGPGDYGQGKKQITINDLLLLEREYPDTIVDSTMSDTSENPVQNKVVKSYVDLIDHIPTSEKGQPNGVATLDGAGLIPAGQLPSYIDDIQTFPTKADFPATGQQGIIYFAIDTLTQYRWVPASSTYEEIIKGAVQTVFGRKDDVVAQTGDYTADQITETTRKFTSQAEKDKLAGIESGAQANVGTDLSSVRTSEEFTIRSSTGQDTTIPGAHATLAGLMTGTDKAKLDTLSPSVDVDLGISKTSTQVEITNTAGDNAVIPTATSTEAGVLQAVDKSHFDEAYNEISKIKSASGGSSMPLFVSNVNNVNTNFVATSALVFKYQNKYLGFKSTDSFKLGGHTPDYFAKASEISNKDNWDTAYSDRSKVINFDNSTYNQFGFGSGSRATGLSSRYTMYTNGVDYYKLRSGYADNAALLENHSSSYFAKVNGDSSVAFSASVLSVGTSSGVAHIRLIRDGYNYIQADKSNGALAFVTGGKYLSDADASLVLDKNKDAVFKGNVEAYGYVHANNISNMAGKNFWNGTQSQYDNIGSKDSNTIYFINE